VSKRRTDAPIVLGIISDTHAGSTIGLSPPEGVRLDGGQEVKPSPFQRWQWTNYENFWGRVADTLERTRGRLWVVSNGDAIEGQHHGTTQIMGAGKDAQAYLAARMFDPIETLQPERVFLVRGTEAHVGQAGTDEEALASSLRHRLPIIREPGTDLWSWWRLPLLAHETFIDFQHHGTGVSGLKWTAPGAIARLGFKIWVEFLEKGWRPPDLAIRSHLHRYHDSFGSHPTRAVITPAWQGKTAHAHKVVPESLADYGGIILTVWPERRYHLEPVLYRPEPIVPWRPT
jgi:hypothetical protein